MGGGEKYLIMRANEAAFSCPFVVQEGIYYTKRARWGFSIHQTQPQAYLVQNWNRGTEAGVQDCYGGIQQGGLHQHK